MQPYLIDDPRDKLAKATRWELVAYAKANGVELPLGEETPAMTSAQILRGRGFINPPIGDQALGMPPGTGGAPEMNTTRVVEVDASDDLMRQMMEEKRRSTEIKPNLIDGMKGNELRAECKRRGIPMKRTDTMADLKAKLNG